MSLARPRLLVLVAGIVALLALARFTGTRAWRYEFLNTSLHRAIETADGRYTHNLLHTGADPNGSEPDPKGCTALIHAVEHGNAPLVRLLLEHGADIRRAARNGQTAIGEAEAVHRADIARILRATSPSPAPPHTHPVP